MFRFRLKKKFFTFLQTLSFDGGRKSGCRTSMLIKQNDIKWKITSDDHYTEVAMLSLRVWTLILKLEIFNRKIFFFNIFCRRRQGSRIKMKKFLVAVIWTLLVNHRFKRWDRRVTIKYQENVWMQSRRCSKQQNYKLEILTEQIERVCNRKPG